MNENDYSQELWEQSASAWISAVERGDVNRTYLLDEPMLRLCQGTKAIDVGCGEGRFCRMLRQRGIEATGIDPTETFVSYALREDPGGQYIRGSGEELPFAADSYDLAIFYLTLIDIPDFRAAIREAARVLRPGGKIVVANLNSFSSTQERAWYRDAEGRKLHVAINDYFEERSLLLDWSGIRILNFHRPFEMYANAFLAEGLLLDAFEEPRPSLANVAAHPTMIDEYRVPLFHVMRWRKPVS